jgi:hypothetical protein
MNIGESIRVVAREGWLLEREEHRTAVGESVRVGARDWSAIKVLLTSASSCAARALSLSLSPSRYDCWCMRAADIVSTHKRVPLATMPSLAAHN